MATLVASATANFDGLDSDSTVYATATAGSGTLSSTGSSANAGQTFVLSHYHIYEAFLEFDLSSISGASMSAATHASAFTADNHGGSTYTLQMRAYDYGVSVTTADFRTGTQFNALTNVATLASSSISSLGAGTYFNWTDVALLANLTAGAKNRFVYSTSRVAAATTPTGNEYATMDTANAPKITITYTGGTTTATAGIATGTGAVNAPTATVQPQPSAATGTGAANAPKATIQPNAGIATGTGAALAATATVKPNAGIATGTGLANNPSAYGERVALPSTATGTGAVNAPALTVTPNAGIATGTGAVNASKATVQPTTSTATGTGAAYTPTVIAIVSPPVGVEFWVYIPGSDGAYAKSELMNGARKGSWRHPFDDVGQGSFEIDSTDDKATTDNLAVDNLIACYIDGTLRYAFLVETPRAILASPDGPSGEPWTISGRGLEAYLEKAVVYPGGWASTVVRPLATTTDPTVDNQLALAASAGATNVKIDIVSNLVAGGSYEISATSGSETSETVVVTVVGTAGAGGTGLTLSAPLAYDHALHAPLIMGLELWPHHLAADTAIGASVIKVNDITGFAVGTLYVVRPWEGGTPDTEEVIKITSVGTAGSGGTGLGFANDAGGSTLRIVHGTTSGPSLMDQALGSLLSANSSVGATNLKVDGITDYSPGLQITVGASGAYETRVLTAVGTAGSGGSGISFTTPLLYAHTTGEFCVVTTNTYSTRRTFNAPAGAILATLLSEAQTGRGELPALDQSFTTSTDTNHVGWGSNVVLELNAGTSLLAAWQQLIGLGLDTAMHYDESSALIVIDAWSSDPSSDLTSSVVLRQGHHIRGSLARELRQDQWRSRILVEGANGAYVEVISANETVKNRRDGYLTFSNTDDTTTLTLAGTEALAAAASAAAPINVPVFHGFVDQFTPYVDYNPGDTIALDVPGTWTQSAQKVVAIVVSQNDGGDYDLELDLGAPEYNASVEMKRQIAALGSRTLAGSAVSTGSVSGSSIADGSITASQLDASGDYTMESLTITDTTQATGGLRIAGTDFALTTDAILTATTNANGAISFTALNQLFAVYGFVLPTYAGSPSGHFPGDSGAAVYDTTNHKLWIYSGGTWRGVVLS